MLAQDKRPPQRSNARQAPKDALTPRFATAVSAYDRAVVMDSTQAFPVPLDLLTALGSLISSRSHGGGIDPAGETDSYLIDLDMAQSVSVVLQPDDGSLRGQLRLLGPGASHGRVDERG